MSERSDMLRRCYAAWLAQDRAVPEALLADDFTFTSPYDEAIDKDAWFQRCWPASDRIESLVIETICEDEDGAFVLYHCATKEGAMFRNTERFTFAGDKVRRVEVFFGPEWRDGRFASR